MAAAGNTTERTLDLVDEGFATGSIGSLRKDFKGAMWPQLGGGEEREPMGKHTASKKDKLAGGVLLGALASEPGCDALSAYEADLASQAGYTRGPDGEWISAAPAERWARR